jgi:hypothetical protein
MNIFRAIYHLALADFRERVQRYSFVFTLLATAYLGLAVVAGDIHLHLGQFRGVFNSAWVGLLMAMTISTFVSLAGFYLVKNAMDRDRQTGVGQILATAPISRLTYVVGKLLSNLSVLGSIVIVLAVAAVVTQLMAQEASRLDLWALLSPFVFIALPALAFAGALAMLFETVPWLRGGFGNLVYFGLWLFLLSWSLETHNRFADFTGFQFVADKLGDCLRQSQPDFKSGIGLSVGDGDAALRTFVWPGFDWSSTAVWLRMYWFGVSFGLCLLSALWFDRFDPARSGKRKWRTPASGGRSPAVPRSSSALNSGFVGNEAAAKNPLRRELPAPPLLTAAPGFTSRSRFAGVLLAELRLMLKGQSWWWYTGVAILLITSLANPLKEGREGLLPFVWLWPILLWSPMGTREFRYHTTQFLFTAPHALSRQLPALWLAGVMVALLTGGGIGLRLLLAQDWSGLAGWAVGAMFIPTAALAMGVWSRSSKLFEALFILCWYIGPIQKVSQFNFMTTSPAAIAAGLPRIYLGAIIVLLVAALIGRRRQMEIG